jgi:hypothetical protein
MESNETLGPRWSTSIDQFDHRTPSTHWVVAICCAPCVIWRVKSSVDESSVAYNTLCWNPVASYSYIRLAYGIDGECSNDCVRGSFCIWCGARQAYTEWSIRGALRGPFSRVDGLWSEALCDAPLEHWFTSCCCWWSRAHLARQSIQPGSDMIFDACCVNPMALYGWVRRQYGIAPDVTGISHIDDICVPLVCCPCAVSRSVREVEARRRVVEVDLSASRRRDRSSSRSAYTPLMEEERR